MTDESAAQKASQKASTNASGDAAPADYAERTVTICNLKGLHARASAKFVKCAEAHEAEITVIKDDVGAGASVGGTSMLGLMSLAAGPGTVLTLTAVGPGAAAALDALAALIDCGFDEELA